MTTAREASGRLTLDAVRKAVEEFMGHQRRAPRSYPAVVGLWLLFCLYFAPFVTFPLVQRMPMESWIWLAPMLSVFFPAFVFLLGLAPINNWYVRRGDEYYARAWSAVDIPEAVDARYVIEDDGFAMYTDRGRFMAYWPSISTLARVSEGWLVVSDLSTYLVPSTAFPDEKTQEDFVAAVLARVDAKAVARSKDAREFAGLEKPGETPAA
ncbi:MAG: hypothetical protein ACM308_01015 [Qipengyuania vulgaris]